MSGGTLLLRRCVAALAFAVFGPGAAAADLKPWTGGKAPGLVLKDLKGATIDTYHDHRMAMSFALAGLRIPGVRIANPGCVEKTYPQFFKDLAMLVG